VRREEGAPLIPCGRKAATRKKKIGPARLTTLLRKAIVRNAPNLLSIICLLWRKDKEPLTFPSIMFTYEKIWKKKKDGKTFAPNS